MLYGDGQLNMSGTFGGTTDFNSGAAANLRLTALYTTGSGQIFIRARWNDTIFNLDRRRALFNGPADPLKDDDPAGFTSQLNDDKIAFAWEIESASSEFGSFNDVGCAASCHNVAGVGLDMRPAEGKVDIWHWKTSRSEPLGFVNDQVSDLVDGRVTDAGGDIEVRNLKTGGDNRSGPKFIWDGTDETVPAGAPRAGEIDDPAFILLLDHLLDVSDRDGSNGNTVYQANCAGCHGANGQGGIGPTLITKDFGRISDAQLDADITAGTHPGKAAYDALTDAQKKDLRLRVFAFWGTPGYFLQLPCIPGTPGCSSLDITSIGETLDGSPIDYSQAGINSLTNITTPQGPDDNAALNIYKFQQDGYCVVIVRDLDTGNADDTQFDPSQQYTFGVALMDNDGKNHIGNTKLTLSFLP
jgi:mono/diheme cytochrome c family protein